MITLLLLLNYHLSIIRAAIRGDLNNSTCDCTVHPAFLIDSSYFNCQEDHSYNVSDLKSAMNDYIADFGTLDTDSQGLYNFLYSTQDVTIDFNSYYSYYVSNSDFNLFLGQQINSISGNCGWWCPIGCGSDHGCCGNYSGCCLYRNIMCYVHDKLCTDCNPSWFCLPGCVPDSSQPNVDSISVY